MNADVSINLWEKDIQTIVEDTNHQLKGLNKSQLNWKPSPDVWSVAQNLDHLITVNRSYFPVIDKMNEGNYSLPLHAKIPILTSFLGDFIYKSVDPKNLKKITTFSIWEPTSSELDTTIIDRFLDHQERLMNKMRESGGLLEKNAIIASPANRYIVYPLERAFDIIIAHERRHMNQAMDILPLLDTKAEQGTSN